MQKRKRKKKSRGGIGKGIKYPSRRRKISDRRRTRHKIGDDHEGRCSNLGIMRGMRRIKLKGGVVRENKNVKEMQGIKLVQ